MRGVQGGAVVAYDADISEVSGITKWVARRNKNTFTVCGVGGLWVVGCVCGLIVFGRVKSRVRIDYF